jgi:CheY-like chemotaxis protein
MMTQKVLLVDDIDFFLELQKDFLRNTDVEVITANNGQQALEAAMREKPKLIFMDVTMPTMDGLTCCRLLKADSHLRDIPVVMVFAGSKDITSETCLKAGCDGVLTKPVDRQSFLHMGRRFLPQIERREHRVPCETPVAIQLKGKQFQAVSADISNSGMYICCREETARNDMVRVGIGGMSAQIMAKVRWINQGPARDKKSLPEGFGVEFTQPNPDAKVIIQELVSRCS